MSEWQTVKLGEIADVFDGPHATPKKTTHGPWFLSISSLSSGRLDLSQSAHLSEEDYVIWTRRVTPREGDVLFSYETRLGEAAMMPAGLRACLGRRMGLLRPKIDRVNPRFLLYAYLSPVFQQQIRERTVHGATVDRIPISEMPSWEVRLPDGQTQERIASVLGALDDKIALNDRLALLADRLAESVYERTVAVAQGVQELGDLIDLKYGKSLPRAKRRPGRVPVYGSGGVSGSHDDAVVTGPGVIVGRKGTVGSVHWSEVDFFPIDTTYYVSLRKPWLSMEYVYFTIRRLDLRSMNFDSAVPGLNREAVLALPVPIPSATQVQAFTRLARSLFRKIYAHQAENSVLSSMRDALLPRLMSGELRVRGGERVPEAMI